MDSRLDMVNSKDYAANVQGQLTQTQHNQLQLLVHQIFWKIVSVFLLMLLLIIGVMIIGNISTKWLVVAIVLLLLIGLPLSALFLIPWLRKHWPLYLQTQRDLANVVICQANGQIEYMPGFGYIFYTAEDEILSLWLGGDDGLRNDMIYSVNYLNISKLVISATALRDVSSNQKMASLNRTLAWAYKFSVDDLLANHNGQVTNAQRRKLILMLLKGFGLIFVSLFGFLALFGRITTFYQLIALVLLGGVLFASGLYVARKALLDMIAPDLISIEGVVTKGSETVSGYRPYQTQTEYYYMINDKKLVVKYQAYDALIGGLKYRIYYLARTNQLLSIEVLEM